PGKNPEGSKTRLAAWKLYQSRGTSLRVPRVRTSVSQPVQIFVPFRRTWMKLGHWLFAVFCLSSQSLFAEDWPQWRWPDRNGISKETGLLPEWPKQGPKLLWQVNDIDYGYSTPSVVGDRLYLMSTDGDSDEFVRALS